MLSREQNETLTRVGPGTPAGEMLRRYWWPVGFSEQVKVKGSPIRAKLLGEDFILFRDGGARLGMVDLHCSHRGTSLEFGRVEEQGIRCCYHGWLYDIFGKCLEQPAEPADSIKDHQTSGLQSSGSAVYFVHRPRSAPLMPRYDLCSRRTASALSAPARML
jgi:5,5'-dehydrodivanillate O-demethylase